LDFRQDWIPGFINYIDQCIEKGAVLILLFGSRATGDFLKDSDIDLLIVSPNLPARIRDRSLGFFSDTLPVQPFLLTPEELKERIEQLDFLVFDAFEDGVVMYSKIDMDHITDMLHKSKERFKLRRVKDGWKFDAVEAEAAGI
jgi:predicted nucleotidyltransferase